MKTRFKLLVLLLSLSIGSHAQTKVITKTAKVNFEASVPAFEEIKAKNESTSVILNTDTGEIASLALVKGFHFRIPLMEEHFNENYMESDSYPKATFKGKIENFDISKLSVNAQNYTIKGKMEMHGKSKEITINATIKKTNEGIQIYSSFSLDTNDYNIDIPAIVSKKVSRKVMVTLDALLK